MLGRITFIAAVFLCSATLALGAGFALGSAALADLEDRYGPAARVRVEQWQELLRTDRHLSDVEKLRRVNDFFNRLRFVSDLEHWGREDYWATPLETLATAAGDCEDFSIAKYFTLKELGVAEERMRLTYVKAIRLNQAHMVVTYFATPDADPLVLDNLDGDLKLASQRNDLYPVYSFNGEGLWLAKARGAGKQVGRSERISLWRDLIGRMDREGAADKRERTGNSER